MVLGFRIYEGFRVQVLGFRDNGLGSRCLRRFRVEGLMLARKLGCTHGAVMANTRGYLKKVLLCTPRMEQIWPQNFLMLQYMNKLLYSACTNPVRLA